MASRRAAHNTSEERLNAFFNAPREHEKFQDAEIDEVALLLERCGSPAAKFPRTYIVLQSIRRLEVLSSLLKEGFGDDCFPVGTTRGLPTFLEPRIANEILSKQWIIETDALDFEHGKHLNLTAADAHLFDLGDILGSGHFGQVNKIVSRVSFKEYALKRIGRTRAFGNRSKEAIRDFLAEKERMKRLRHPHIVQYIGSYTDRKHFGLVMSPIADYDLAKYMQMVCEEHKQDENSSRRQTLQSFFGCLAAALSYLHSEGIRHRDIKPANVLVRGSNVLITDFGISRDFLDTTSGVTMHTPRYSAPEVAQGTKRNESADMWSLGCVFVEMAAALHGLSIDRIREYFVTRYTHSEMYHANLEAIDSLLSSWVGVWHTSEHVVLLCIRSMLVLKREDRPTAARVLELITSHVNPTTFCGICCAGDEHTDSDFSLSDTVDTVYQENSDEPKRALIAVKRNRKSTSPRQLLYKISSSPTTWLICIFVTLGVSSVGLYIQSDKLWFRGSSSVSLHSSSIAKLSSTPWYDSVTQPMTRSEIRDFAQSDDFVGKQSQLLETNLPTPVTTPTPSLPVPTPETKDTRASKEPTKTANNGDGALDLLWYLVTASFSWTIRMAISSQGFRQLVLLGTGYLMVANISVTHSIKANALANKILVLAPGLLAILSPLGQVLKVLIVVFSLPCLIICHYPEEEIALVRLRKAGLGSAVLLVEFWTVRWVIGGLVWLLVGLPRTLFDPCFLWLLVVPMLVVISGDVLLSAGRLAAGEPHYLRGTVEEEIQVSKESLLGMMDYLTAVLCWLWILPWILPAIKGLLRWMFTS